MNEKILDGNKINCIEEFHKEIASILSFPDFYGNNLDALWDCLTGHIDTNFKLVWINHLRNKYNLGDDFDSIIAMFDDLKQEQEDFDYELK